MHGGSLRAVVLVGGSYGVRRPATVLCGRMRLIRDPYDDVTVLARGYTCNGTWLYSGANDSHSLQVAARRGERFAGCRGAADPAHGPPGSDVPAGGGRPPTGSRAWIVCRPVRGGPSAADIRRTRLLHPGG